MTLNLVIWILWGMSLIGTVFIVIKKAPILMSLPEELLFKETFIDFSIRKIKEILSKLNELIEKIKPYLQKE